MTINYQPQPGVRNETLGSAAGILTVACSTTANTKSGWTAIGTPAFSYEQIVVFMENGANSAADFVVDIGVATGATGYAVAVQDLRLDSIAKVQGGSQGYYIPVTIPMGVQIGARVSSNSATANLGICIIGSSRGIRGSPGYSKCFAISTATVSRGISLYASGALASDGAFTVMTSSCQNNVDAIFAVVGMAGDAAKTAGTTWRLDVYAGTSSAAAAPIFEDAAFRAETVGDRVWDTVAGPFPCRISKGDVVQARILSSSSATADNGLDVMIYGLVP